MRLPLNCFTGLLVLAAASCGEGRSRAVAGGGGGPATAPATGTAPATVPAPAPGVLAPLTVRVVDVRNHKGQLIFGVFRSADGFPKESGKSVFWQVLPADAGPAVFTAMLPPGRYGASVLHDENGNNRMDLNALGIPLEGYGVTNNPKPRFRAATFEESTFDLPPEGATLVISVQYF